MNKDALLATLIGFFIGVVITGGILFGPKVLKFIPKVSIPSLSFSQSPQKKSDKMQVKPTISEEKQSADLTISSPLSASISSTDILLVSGRAPSGSFVIIGGLLDEDALIAKEDGTYAGKITLAEGKNDITVSAFSDGKSISKNVEIFYTPEKL